MKAGCHHFFFSLSLSICASIYICAYILIGILVVLLITNYTVVRACGYRYRFESWLGNFSWMEVKYGHSRPAGRTHPAYPRPPSRLWPPTARPRRPSWSSARGSGRTFLPPGRTAQSEATSGAAPCSPAASFPCPHHTAARTGSPVEGTAIQTRTRGQAPGSVIHLPANWCLVRDLDPRKDGGKWGMKFMTFPGL